MNEQIDLFAEITAKVSAVTGREDESLPRFTDDDMGRLYHTALQAGLSIVSKENCCRLLAWVYVFGGGNEAIISNKKLLNAMVYAQRRLNILGGEAPDVEWLPVLRDYVADAEHYVSAIMAARKERGWENDVSGYVVMPDWLEIFENDYKIKSRV